MCSGLMTFTVGAPSGFTAPFRFTIVNNGTRGVLINLNGTNAWLYPGCYIHIWNSAATAWETSVPLTQAYSVYTSRYFVGMLAPATAISTSGVTVYVNQTSGSDDNDGLAAGSGNAFKTLSRAWIALHGFHHNGTNPAIQLAAENYNTSLDANGAVYVNGCPPGTHAVVIQGDSGTVTGSYQIRNGGNNSIAVNVNDGAVIIWKGIEFTSNTYTACIGLLPARNVVCDFTQCIFGAYLSGNALEIQNGAQCSLTGPCTIAVGSAASFAYIGPGGFLEFGANTYTCSAAMAFSTSFVFCSYPGAMCIVDTGATFTGTGSGSGSTGYGLRANYVGVCNSNGVTGIPGASGAYAVNGGYSI
jgi:hypothetical protein